MTVRHVQEVAEYRPLEIQWVVPTFVDGRVKKSSEILDQVVAAYGNRVTEPIRYNVRLSEAPGWGKTIYEYDPASAGATGGISNTSTASTVWPAISATVNSGRRGGSMGELGRRTTNVA